MIKATLRVSVLLIFTSFAVVFPIFQFTKASVVLAVNGKEEVIQTHSTTIEEVLEEQDIKLKKEDKIVPSLNTEVKDDMTIKLELAKEVTLSIDNEEKEVWTTAETAEELIQEQEVELHKNDLVKPKKNTEIKKGMEVSITKAVPVRYTDPARDVEVWTTSDTVSDFLHDNKISLGKTDRVEPEGQTVLTKGMHIKVVRIEKSTEVVEEKIDFETVTNKDASLKAGTELVMQEGEKGLIKSHFEVVKENGKEVSQKLLKKETAKEPKNRIISVGTKVIKNQVSKATPSTSAIPSRGTPPSGGREFFVSATAYTADCYGCSGITATGLNLKSNPDSKVIAVDPKVIPLGSKVWVEGYGYAVASDTGGAIKGNKIDLFISSESQALNFGRKTVRIKVFN